MQETFSTTTQKKRKPDRNQTFLFVKNHQVILKKGKPITIDRLVAKMKLTAVEYETLCAYMAGLTYSEIARIMEVNRTTIWRRQNSIRKKYMSALQ